jgi:hypothetical protein
MHDAKSSQGDVKVQAVCAGGLCFGGTNQRQCVQAMRKNCPHVYYRGARVTLFRLLLNARAWHGHL